MDFSSYITIKNKTKYTLSLTEQHADHGDFKINAPGNIPSAQSGNFQIIDTSGAAYGSGGHVTYNIEGANANVQLIFGCPYSDSNYAQYRCSNNDAITVRFRGTNGGNPEASDWGTFPAEGHPLSLEFEIIYIE